MLTITALIPTLKLPFSTMGWSQLLELFKNSPNTFERINFIGGNLNITKSQSCHIADDTICLYVNCSYYVLFITNPAFLSCRMGRNLCNSNKILSILLYHIFLISVSTTSANEPDRLALLDLKSRVLKDPLGILSSWNDSAHFCD